MEMLRVSKRTFKLTQLIEKSFMTGFELTYRDSEIQTVFHFSRHSFSHLPKNLEYESML